MIARTFLIRSHKEKVHAGSSFPLESRANCQNQYRADVTLTQNDQDGDVAADDEDVDDDADDDDDVDEEDGDASNYHQRLRVCALVVLQHG